MALFAEIGEDNTVIRVIVLADSDCGDLGFPESELAGQQFITSLGIDGVWKQTSTDGEFRQTGASVGSVYFDDTDAFIVGRPYESWSLNANREWTPPKPRPTPDGEWLWSEATQEWTR